MNDALARRLVEVSQLRGDFVLRSGETSSEYFDKYLFESDPRLLLEVATAMVDLLPPCDAVGGMELGGVPLVAVLSQLSGLPAVFVRKAAKSYGTRKAVEGIVVEGLRVVAVEDVVTTAGALMAGCDQLRRAGAIVGTGERLRSRRLQRPPEHSSVALMGASPSRCSRAGNRHGRTRDRRPGSPS